MILSRMSLTNKILGIDIPAYPQGSNRFTTLFPVILIPYVRVYYFKLKTNYHHHKRLSASFKSLRTTKEREILCVYLPLHVTFRLF